MISPERQLSEESIGLQANYDWLLSPDALKITLAQLLKQTPDLKEKIDLTRSFLQFMVSINPDSIDGLFNIRIIERNKNKPSLEDCFTYLVGKDVDVQRFHDEMFETHTLSREPLPRAYALYLKDKTKDLKATHIGRVTDDLTVISKWGLNGHVYEHLPALVPISYGSLIAYYSPPKV